MCSLFVRILLVVGWVCLTSRASPVPYQPPSVTQPSGPLVNPFDNPLSNNNNNDNRSRTPEDAFNQASSEYASSVIEQRNRDKQMRLQNIKNYVLSSLGYGKLPSSGKVHGSEGSKPVEKPFSGQLHTFPATCDVPANVETDMWIAPGYFHLFFNLTWSGSNSSNASSQQQQPSTLQKTTVSAKLRLYKLGTVGSESEENGSSNNATAESLKVNGTGLTFPGDIMPIVPVVEEKIRVSLYWYRAPVTKHHYKKKLLDTKMLSVKESKWVDFDIINAAVPWLDEKLKNFGLVLQVENEDNDLVDPNKYFVNLPCSTNSSEGTTLLPTVEICTLSTPQQSSKEVAEDEAPSFFPFPMGQSFSYLNRVAKAHAAANSQASAMTSDWQNDDLSRSGNSYERQQPHHHRHRHGGRTMTKQMRHATTSSTFRLDEDHPLRHILENSSGGQESKAFMRPVSTDSFIMESGEDDDDRDIIIQKIYISSPSNNGNQQGSLNR